MDLNIFSEAGECTVWEHTDPSQLEQRTCDCDIIITNRVKLGKEELKKMPNLKLICLTATGFNTIDTEYCRKNHIGVANVAGYSTESVAQHTFSMLLYLAEHSRYYDDYIRQERYKKDNRFADVSRPWYEISGKTWGIIGLGAIGRRVAGWRKLSGPASSTTVLRV